jgi:hypothetical protein
MLGIFTKNLSLIKKSVIYILIQLWTRLSACKIVDSIGIIYHYKDIVGVEIDVDPNVSIRCLLFRIRWISSLWNADLSPVSLSSFV